ncbi:hypothetical protein ACWGB8_05440 [Kitasatospora sp. NPDC054939]
MSIETRSTGTCPANEFRIRIGQWLQSLPTGGPWKSLGSGFTAFLLHAAQKADVDGTNLHRSPSNAWFARACRVSKDSVPGFYRAAEAAGLMTLRYGSSGTRVRGYAVTLPLGGTPDWGAALDVLRSDTRRVKQECVRLGKPARAVVPRQAAGEHRSARAESGKSARAGSQVRTCGVNQDVSHHGEMAEAVGTGTTPRASNAPAEWESMARHLPSDLRPVAESVPEDNALRRTATAALQHGWLSPGGLAARAAVRRPAGGPHASPADRLALGLVSTLAALAPLARMLDDLTRLLATDQVGGHLLL